MLLVAKGDNSSQDGDVGGGDYATTEVTQNAVYLEVPITVAYTIQLGRRFNITLNTGPYIACGLGGKSKLETNATIGGSPISGGFEKVRLKLSNDSTMVGCLAYVMDFLRHYLPEFSLISVCVT